MAQDAHLKNALQEVQLLTKPSICAAFPELDSILRRHSNAAHQCGTPTRHSTYSFQSTTQAFQQAPPYALLTTYLLFSLTSLASRRKLFAAEQYTAASLMSVLVGCLYPEVHEPEAQDKLSGKSMPTPQEVCLLLFGTTDAETGSEVVVISHHQIVSPITATTHSLSAGDTLWIDHLSYCVQEVRCRGQRRKEGRWEVGGGFEVGDGGWKVVIAM